MKGMQNNKSAPQLLRLLRSSVSVWGCAVCVHSIFYRIHVSSNLFGMLSEPERLSRERITFTNDMDVTVMRPHMYVRLVHMYVKLVWHST